MDIILPEGHCCLVVDDGTQLAQLTVQRLEQRGWPVVVLCLPQAVVPRRQAWSESTHRVQLDDLSEDRLQAALADAASRFGPVAVLIHLHPDCHACQGEGLHFTDTSKQVLQVVFLAAKYLKESLNKAAHLGRAAFMTVVRLDGEFGLGDRVDYDPISGGLFGLVKSLNLEWESVFCRAVDLDPEIDAVQAADYLMAELMDPNRRLVEVGYSSKGRATLVLEAAMA